MSHICGQLGTDRMPVLRETPAAVRFLPSEPLLGPLLSLDLAEIGRVIVGGEERPLRRAIDAGVLGAYGPAARRRG